MKLTVIAAAGSLLVCSLAHAQPDPGPPAPPEPGDGEAPPPPDHGERIMLPPPPAPPPPAPVAARPTRPPGLSLGLGLGYKVPTDLNLPNVTSARFRLASGLTLEPLVVLTNDNATTDDGSGAGETTDTQTDLELAVAVRYPVMRRDRVDLMVLGSIGVGSIKSDPEGPGNAQTVSVFALTYGLGLEYWLDSHWSLSVDARNPIVVHAGSSRDNGEGLPESTTSHTTLGAVFDPTLFAMIHLYL